MIYSIPLKILCYSSSCKFYDLLSNYTIQNNIFCRKQTKEYDYNDRVVDSLIDLLLFLKRRKECKQVEI